ncbi:MAG TPA: hypothetical protein VF103_07140, partial [Polyangiaceae bacterium]
MKAESESSGRLTAAAQALKRGFEELSHTEWLPADELEARAFRRLETLVTFAARRVPFYQRRFGSFGSSPKLDRSSFRSLPILERHDVQSNDAELSATSLPSEHGRIHEVETAGSTGRPIRALSTDLAQHVWSLVMLREHAWQRRDARGVAAAIRWFPDGVNGYPHGGSLPNWGAPISLLHDSGPSHALSITATAAEQVEWLGRIQP